MHEYTSSERVCEKRENGKERNLGFLDRKWRGVVEWVREALGMVVAYKEREGVVERGFRERK